MRYRSGVILTCLISLLPAGEALAIQGGRQQTVTAGFVTDGPYQRYTEIRALVREEILGLLTGEFDVRLPESKFLQANWTVSSVERVLDQQLADPEVDLVITLGPISSHLASRRRNLPKPLVAPFIINAEIQQTPRDGAGSGVPNLTYVALPEELDLPAFREIVPFTRLAVLANEAIAEAIPELAERIRTASRELGLDPTIIPSSEPSEGLVSLCRERKSTTSSGGWTPSSRKSAPPRGSVSASLCASRSIAGGSPPPYRRWRPA